MSELTTERLSAAYCKGFTDGQDSLHSRIQELERENEKFRIGLGFYADEENWDDDKFSPTVWENGSIDMGNIAREALKRGEG